MRFDSIALRDARMAKHLSQQDLAVMANVGPGTISRLELGEHENPQVGTVMRLAQTLSVAPSTLIRD